MSRIYTTLATCTLAMMLIVLGCAGKPKPEADAEAKTKAKTEAELSLTKTTEMGPVKATVTLTPREPLLGDNLKLELRVESASGVRVEMPAFGEALGRFSIVDYKPTEETKADGTAVQSQMYTLQAPMSGRQRIPPLRLEFLDERPGQTSANTVGGARELLTEELTLDVKSALAEGEVKVDLRPLRTRLGERPGSLIARYGAIVGGLAALVLAFFGGRAWLSYRRARIRASAYDVAIARIAKLERRGLPAPEDADAWYVELSGIVRRYLEDRFGVRAPELTTEEFLREARRSKELTPAHRDLLSAFLERCDRVKFAAYHPEESESKEILSTSRSFLLETRIVTESKRPAAAAA